ncbi:hypothetical protein N7532_004385 [Penicillium argentinense]|uniref:Uncharacterized protein n=1 Tax=Penicillium argentinense TaxID=1131581 RepID=A0A9W9FP94_9EURO|nr:uncharacterized protein N7532_004385 [Penicillium argentinense]KAJ5103856.1 hypothetical protein N7532_004385 [Penicillium argentinense]
MWLTLIPSQSDPGISNERAAHNELHTGLPPRPQSEPSPRSSLMNRSRRELPPLVALARVRPAMPTPLPTPSGTYDLETMRQWLQAKAEEDRRAQEEEKTRQESLRLEQRKVEQNILQESLRGGITPTTIPSIFAAMGRAGNPGFTTDMSLQYTPQQSQNLPYPTQSRWPFPGPGQPAGPSTTLPPLTQTFDPQKDARVAAPAPVYHNNQHLSASRANTPSHIPENGGTSVLPANTTAHSPLPPPATNPRSQAATPAYMQNRDSPGTSQPASARQIPRPRGPSNPISFHHWVPPGQAQSQPQGQLEGQPQGQPQGNDAPCKITEPDEKKDTPAEVDAGKYIQSSPGRKRKSESTHRASASPFLRHPRLNRLHLHETRVQRSQSGLGGGSPNITTRDYRLHRNFAENPEKSQTQPNERGEGAVPTQISEQDTPENASSAIDH